MKKEVKEEKINVEMKDGQGFFTDLIVFYHKHIRKIHIIVTIIAMLIYAFASYKAFKNINNGNYYIPADTTAKTLLGNLKEDAMLSFIAILAGIVPFCYIAIIGIAQAGIIVNDIALRYVFDSTFMFTGILGGIIKVIGVGLVVAVGLYYCKLSSKKNKYYHQSGFTFNDVKLSFYDLRKNEKKVEELTKKKEERARKIQESNIKMPYGYFAVLGLIGFVIQAIGSLITRI